MTNTAARPAARRRRYHRARRRAVTGSTVTAVPLAATTDMMSPISSWPALR